MRKDGYVIVRVDKGNYQLEHRVVMGNEIGRKLRSEEHVHHRNQARNDNRPDNLQVTDVVSHAKIHAPQRDPSKWVSVACGNCGEQLSTDKDDPLGLPIVVETTTYGYRLVEIGKTPNAEVTGGPLAARPVDCRVRGEKSALAGRQEKGQK